MAQSLWYVRQDDRILGPFPAPQIVEFLDSGDVRPDWQISLNGQDWLTIVESGQFDEALLNAQDIKESDSRAWRDERQKARQRWLQEPDIVAEASSRDPVQDASLRRAISNDQLRTEALLQAEKHRRKSLIPMLLGVGLLLLAGGVIWLGQQDDGIQPGIASVANCAAAAADGVNWSRCDKRGAALGGLKARNARMARTRLDDARLGGADLSYAILTGASLRNVELAGAVLTGAELSGADLSGADLARADLQYAVLKGAAVAGTRFDSARLDKAIWVDGRECAPGSLGLCR